MSRKSGILEGLYWLGDVSTHPEHHRESFLVSDGDPPSGDHAVSDSGYRSFMFSRDISRHRCAFARSSDLNNTAGMSISGPDGPRHFYSRHHFMSKSRRASSTLN